MNDSSLRNALLAADPPSPELERLFRERLRHLSEQRMSGSLRVAHTVSLLIALGTAIQCAVTFGIGWGHLSPGGLAGLVLAFTFCLGWVVATGLALRDGVDRVFGNNAARSWLVTAFAWLVAALMAWVGLNTADGAQSARFLLFGLLVWCAAGLPFLLAQLVREAEVRTRTDVLHLELALAEREASRGGRS